MSGSGALTLADVSGLGTLRIECARCSRAGRYSVDRLIREHGPRMKLPELRELLTEDCPLQSDRAKSTLQRCQAIFPDLIALAQPKRNSSDG